MKLDVYISETRATIARLRQERDELREYRDTLKTERNDRQSRLEAEQCRRVNAEGQLTDLRELERAQQEELGELRLRLDGLRIARNPGGGGWTLDPCTLKRINDEASKLGWNSSMESVEAVMLAMARDGLALLSPAPLPTTAEGEGDVR